MPKLTDTGKFAEFSIFILWAYTLITWIVNLYKFISLVMVVNFDSLQPGEQKHLIIHLIGLSPGCSWVTAWY